MRRINVIGSTAVAVLFAVGAAMAQRTVSLADNAALRYWAAFSQLQDAAITDQEAKVLDSVLDRTASYDISRYSDLIQKRLEILTRRCQRWVALCNSSCERPSCHSSHGGERCIPHGAAFYSAAIAVTKRGGSTGRRSGVVGCRQKGLRGAQSALFW